MVCACSTSCSEIVFVQSSVPFRPSLQTVTLTRNGVPVVGWTSGQTLTDDGLYVLHVEAEDAAGNMAAPQTYTFTIDQTAPVIVVTGIANGVTYPGTVTPQVTITGATESTITLNGQPYVSGTPVTTPGTYTLVVTAADAAGNQASTTITFTITANTAPPTPLNLTATANASSIGVAWSAVSATDLLGYKLYRATSPSGPWTLITASPITSTTYTDMNVEPEVTYYYRVTAIDTTALESAPSNVDDAAIPRNILRLWGDNRFETALEISENTFDSAPVVILARSDNFVDALSASGLAGSHDCPLLLTKVHSLDNATQAEIRRLGVGQVIIVGGTSAVGPEVEAAVRNMGLPVARYGGPTRYDTSVLISQAIEANELRNGRPFSTHYFLARGDNFPDALSVSPLAFTLKAPILLTKPTALPAVTENYVRAESFDSQMVAGGTSAVSDSVAARLAAAATATSVRQGGSTRYVTSAMVASYGVNKGWAEWRMVGIATGKNFPDALTGGVAMGKHRGVLMVTTPDTLHADVRQQFVTNKSKIFGVRLFGGTAALSTNVEQQVIQLMQ